MPQELYRETKQDRFSALENLGLFDCIECGCCDAVCPSHIPLTESFRAGKQSFAHAMDHEALVDWFDAREQRRRQGAQRWETEHGPSTDTRKEQQPARRRLEAVADVIARVNRLPETSEN